MNPLSHLLGYLLHYANRDIPLGLKTEFYKIKQMLLKKHGIKVGQDIQHIKKECYSCDNGTYYGAEWEDMCYNCSGTGIYTQFWSRLDKYKLGKFEFHNPVEKMYSHSPLFEKEAKSIIEGYIRHTTPKYRLGTECSLWLFLFFDRKIFWRRFGRTGYPNNKRTPLVIISNLAFKIRYFKWKDLLPKKKVNYDTPLYFPNGYEDDDLPF